MALDTKEKRLAAINVGSPWRVLPIPDGSIDLADRMTLLGLYSGNPPDDIAPHTPVAEGTPDERAK